MTTGRALKELLVSDLRKELARRNLETSGTKQVLVDRLRKALIDSSEDPEAWRLITNLTISETKSIASDVEVKSTDSKTDAKDEEDIRDNGPDEAAESKEGPNQAADSKENDLNTSSANCNPKSHQESKPENADKANATASVINKEKLGSFPSGVAEENSSKGKDVKHPKCSEDDHSKEETKVCSRASSPAIDCSLVVGTDGGTSDLDRELSNFSESTKSKPETSLIKQDINVASPLNKKNLEDIKEDGGNHKTDDSKSREIWVNNISISTKAINLKTLFSKYGKVLIARIVRKTFNGGSKLCGYVEMSSTEEADKAICLLHKTTLNANVIFCVRGDNKRTEDIISARKDALSKQKSNLVSKISKANSGKTKLPLSGRKSTINDPARKNTRSESQYRREFAAMERKAHVVDRRLQRTVLKEQYLTRREIEVRRNEKRLEEMNRQLAVKIRELDIERQVIRETRNRLDHDQTMHSAKEAELRDYELRLVKAEAQLRDSQEQQQRYYEAQRVRQQKMAVYDEDARKQRHEGNHQPRRLVGRRERSVSARGAVPAGNTNPFSKRRVPIGAAGRVPSPGMSRSSRREPLSTNAVVSRNAAGADNRMWSAAVTADEPRRPNSGRYWDDSEPHPRSAVASRAWQDSVADTVSRSAVSNRNCNQAAFSTNISGDPLSNIGRSNNRPSFPSSSRLPFLERESTPPNKRIKKSFDYRRTRYDAAISGSEIPDSGRPSVQASLNPCGPSTTRLHHQSGVPDNQEYQPNWRQDTSPVIGSARQSTGGSYGRVSSADTGAQRSQYAGAAPDRFDAYRSMVSQMSNKSSRSSGNASTAAVLSALTASTSRGSYGSGSSNFAGSGTGGRPSRF